MKTITAILALMLISTTSNAQFYTKKIKGNGTVISKTRTVSNYHKIGVAGNFNIQLIKGEVGKLTIKADENLMEYIVTEVSKGKLKIKPKKGYKIRSRKNIEVIVPYQKMESVSLAGSGHITAKSTLKEENLKLNIAGSGNINLPVATNSLKTSIAGSGNINLQGNTQNFKCSIAGSGNFNGHQLKAKIATISIAGSGTVRINAIDELHTKNVGSGSVYYYGNPRVIKTKSVGSGSVKKRN